VVASRFGVLDNIAAAINQLNTMAQHCVSVEDAAAHTADNAVAAAHRSVSGCDDRTVYDSGSAYDNDCLGVIRTPCHRDNKSAGSNDGDEQHSHQCYSLAFL
jgi:hypothetical protein